MRYWLFVLATIACRRDPAIEFHRVEYPGFALDVPASLGAPEMGATYPRGTAQTRSETVVYSVTWNTNSLPADSQVEGFAQSLRTLANAPDLAPAKRIRVGGLDALRFDGIGKEEFWSLVWMTCGVRTIQIMVHAQRDGDAILTRMLEHLDCHPIAAEDQKIARAVPVGLDDHARIAGWKRVEDPGAFTITDDTHAASFTKTSGDWRKDLDVLAKAHPPGWTVGAITASQDGQRYWANVTLPEDQHGVAASWPCDGGGVLALVTGYDGTAAHEFLSGFRCPRLGDAPLVGP